MSGIHFRVILGRREFTTSRVFQRSWNNTFGLTVSHPASLIRYQNFSSSPLRSEWTQHALPASFSAPNELVEASSAPKKVHKAFIALGSNLGNKVDWIEKACDEMVARGINIKRTSCLWETEPMYVTDQEKFVNGACEVETTLEPLALLDELQSIENLLGRRKVIDKGPRNIDLDILLYDEEVVNHERLQIPHPLMFEREFVLRPLAELIPGKALNPKSPWKVTQDYLNALPPSPTPISTLTPLGGPASPIRALNPSRSTRVMVILNVTPDSFSDGKPNGDPYEKWIEDQDGGARLYHGQKFDQTIIDVGGQSTAPGTEEVSPDVEIARVVPAILKLKALGSGALDELTLHQKRRVRAVRGMVISVDTYQASVAEAAVQAGAEIINDVSAGQLDPEMFPTMARLGKTVCLMHMRGNPKTMNQLTDYSPDGLIPTIAQELLARVAEAEEAGIRRWRIILDPGIGFAKTSEQNVEILRKLDELREWPGLKGLPWLVGSSRKRFIGEYVGHSRDDHAKMRDWGTAATVAAAVQGGVDIVRVHNAVLNGDVVKMSDAIWRGSKILSAGQGAHEGKRSQAKARKAFEETVSEEKSSGIQ